MSATTNRNTTPESAQPPADIGDRVITPNNRYGYIVALCTNWQGAACAIVQYCAWGDEWTPMDSYDGYTIASLCITRTQADTNETNVQYYLRMAAEFDAIANTSGGVMRQAALARAAWNREQAERERRLEAQIARLMGVKRIPDWR